MKAICVLRKYSARLAGGVRPIRRASRGHTVRVRKSLRRVGPRRA